MNQPKDLLSIGAFADMTHLSVKALRLYDELGLLQPVHIDPQSGYRYYGVDQLSSARRIRNLRDMDMPLSTIRQVLAALESSPAQAEALVQEYVSTRARQVEQIRGQVQTFIRIIQQETTPMALEVSIKKIPTRQVVSITRHVKVPKLESTIRESISAIKTLLQEQKGTAADSPFGIFHGSVTEQEDGPIEICIPAEGTLTSNGDVQVKELQGGSAACVMMIGAQTDFPAILEGYDAVADWIQKNGYQMLERPREVWHNGPGEEPKMEIVWLFT